MEAGGKRALSIAAVALAVAVASSGCAGDGAQDEPGAEAVATTAAPSEPPASTPKPAKPSKPTPKGPAKAQIVVAFRKMQVAFERKDPGAVLRRTGRLSKTYLKKTKKAVATAGRAKIKKLSVWQKLVLTTLRTDLEADEIGALSRKQFLDHVFEYGLDYFPTARLRKRIIEVTGPRTAAAGIGRGPIWFELVEGEWKVEVVGAFETLGNITKEFAKQEGHTIKRAILGLAEEFTRDVVPGDVWSKP